MKKILFIISSFLLLVLISFTKPEIRSHNALNTTISKTLIGDWTYDGLIENGERIKRNSCNEMDVLRFDPSGRFESIQHISLITITTGHGTITNCNPLKNNGSWSIMSNGKLTRNEQSVEIFEITKNSLKLKSIVTSVDEEGKKVTDTYIDCYAKR